MAMMSHYLSSVAVAILLIVPVGRVLEALWSHKKKEALLSGAVFFAGVQVTMAAIAGSEWIEFHLETDTKLQGLSTISELAFESPAYIAGFLMLAWVALVIHKYFSSAEEEEKE